MAKNISHRENEARSLQLLAAQRQLYSWAKFVLALQVCLVVIVPAILLVIEHFEEGFKSWAALGGLTISILDVVLLEPGKPYFQRKAAGIQELFDCYVLELEWPSLKSKKPDPEDLHGAAKGYSTDKLKDWYPRIVSGIPLFAGRIVCQRSNCSWDSKLRRYYRTGLFALSAIVSIVVIGIGLAWHLTLTDFVLTLAPLVPIILWSVREAKQQSEAATRVDQLKSFGNDLWGRVLHKQITETEATNQSRIFQDEIYEHRQRNPMIFDWFYWLFKNKFEEQMTQSAEDMVIEAHENGF
jgi:SMODS-associating 4TM effector domain